MKINTKTGIDQIVFGMKEKDVKAVYGEPDKQFKDDDKNIIYLYNDIKLRLTFYQDENYRLGYIMASHPDLELEGTKVIGKKWEDIKDFTASKKYTAFEMESFDSVDHYFNEDNWLIFQVEFNDVVRVELGAIINSKDEFEWKFKG
jgi:hypothetical protein